MIIRCVRAAARLTVGQRVSHVQVRVGAPSLPRGLNPFEHSAALYIQHMRMCLNTFFTWTILYYSSTTTSSLVTLVCVCRSQVPHWSQQTQG